MSKRCRSRLRSRPGCARVPVEQKLIDGSTDRRCFASVTNERALLSKLGQPVRKVRQSAALCISGG